jgi:hypothetical protein
VSYNSFSQCTLGYASPLGQNSDHSPNYLLGSAINVSDNFELTSLGMIAISAGINFKVAVYNSIGGNPGNLLTQGSGTTISGVNVINVPNVALTPGTYFYMAIFETSAIISYTTNTPDAVWYIPLPYASNLPASFGPPIVYTNQAFSYYFIGTEAAIGTDVQSSCGPYTWIDGTTYTANNNTASYTFPAGASNGCDSIVTLNLTINQPSIGTDIQSACGSYTWMNGITYTSNNNSATHLLPGAAANGCDSIVTLNLTINNLPITGTQLNGVTISSTNTSASYAWLDCDNNNALIPNETNQSFTPSENGNYAVLVTENGCVDTSNCITINTIGLDEYFNNFAFVLYPNPTTGSFTIDLGEDADYVHFSIVNLSGKLIEYNEFKSTSKINYEFTGARGSYFLIIDDGKQKSVFKLIKE